MAWQKAKRVLEVVGLSAIIPLAVSTVVSTYVSNEITSHFEAARENERDRVQMLLYRQQQLDDAQNAVFANLGIYTDKVFSRDNSAETSRVELQSAIVSAQAKLLNLKAQLDKQNKPASDAYDKELSALAVSLRKVSKPEDLGPVFAAAQRVLKTHDALAADVRSQLQVRTM